MVEYIYIWLSYYHMIPSISMELEYQSSNQRALGAVAVQSVDSKSSSSISTGHMGGSIVMGLPQASLGWWKIHGKSQSFLCMMTGISTLQDWSFPANRPIVHCHQSSFLSPARRQFSPWVIGACAMKYDSKVASHTNDSIYINPPSWNNSTIRLSRISTNLET